jgi:PGF-CTERM protein
MRRLTTALIVLVLTASVVPPAMGQDATLAREQASGEAYAGTHVAFDASQSAVTDYAVHGETMLDSVKVESQSSVEDSALVDVGASASAVTQIGGAGLSVDATTETEARVEAENGATMTAHDNGHGILVVASGNQSDYVVANLSSGANASAESDSQVEVTTENGTEGTFIVVGEGNVTVNDDGDVTAHLGDDGRLVFRAYPEEKDDNDDDQERLIADGKAKAEAYVMAANESADDGSDAGEQVVVDTVSYGENTTVETAETAEGEVSFTVNRTTHEGTVLITSVSEEVVDASENLTVTVDGEAATEAATHSQLKSAIGSEQSRYMVESAGSASASADVLVAVNHFSERTVSMTSASSDGTGEETTSDGETTDETNGDETNDGTTDSGTDDAQSDDENNGGGVPGFGATAAIVALVSAALLARIR